MADPMSRIDAAIIGAQKAGTTSLLRWLAQHPAIRAQQGLEFTYFIDREKFDPASFRRLFQKNFPPKTADTAVTLIKHVGLFENAAALQLLKNHNPEAKLILVLRDPAERAYSAFWYAVSRGLEPEPDFVRAAFERPADFFPDPFRRRTTDYVGRGFYHRHLQQLEQIFPREQICLLEFRQLKDDPQGACDRVFHFLGLPPHPIVVQPENQTRLPRFPWLPRLLFWVKPLLRNLPATWRKPLKNKVKRYNLSDRPVPPMTPEIRQRLKNIYREPNELLFNEYGIDYR